MKKGLLFLLFAISISISAQTNSSKEIIRRMFSANETLQTARFTIHSEERLRDERFEIKDMRIKFRRKPEQVYLYAVKPDAGTEIIWKKGWNEDKLYVSPGSFPFVNISIKVNSSLARKDAHHPITNIGFDYLMGLLSEFIKASGEKFYSYISVSDTVKWDNRSCIILKFDYTDYRIVDYTVKQNEDIIQIADKLRLNDYSILVLNPSIDDFDDVKPGQVIKVPNFYCRSIEFYIDRISWLPIKQKISDGKGLYENYEMKSFILNPVFQSDEFDPDYKDYGF